MSKQIVVTLTSIPPRFRNLPKKIASLGRQSVKPDRVEIHLPRIYRRFPGERPSLPPLPDWVSVIDTEVDLGPATKVLPAALRWRGTETDLLLCDDDRLQDRHWVSRFKKTRLLRPDDIIAERGWNVDEVAQIVRESPDQPRAVLDEKRGRTASYRIRRILSLGLHHPERAIYSSAGYADIFEGFLGALVPTDAFPDYAWQIPEIVWTVDDVWLSGMAFAKGNKVWVSALQRPIYADRHFDRVAPLSNYVELGVGRNAANRMAIEHLREHFGIWK